MDKILVLAYQILAHRKDMIYASFHLFLANELTYVLFRG